MMAPPAAGGASVLSGRFVLRLLSRRLSRLLSTLLGALPGGDRDLLGVAALGAPGEADGQDAVGQLDGVAVVAHLHAGYADHAAIALGGTGGQHGVEQRGAEEVALHALEQRVQHRERILVLPRRQAALAAVAG